MGQAERDEREREEFENMPSSAAEHGEEFDPKGYWYRKTKPDEPSHLPAPYDFYYTPEDVTGWASVSSDTLSHRYAYDLRHLQHFDDGGGEDGGGNAGNADSGDFGKQDFTYLPEEDVYRCPAGERLPYRYTNEEAGKVLRRYWTPDCSLNPFAPQVRSGGSRAGSMSICSKLYRSA